MFTEKNAYVGWYDNEWGTSTDTDVLITTFRKWLVITQVDESSQDVWLEQQQQPLYVDRRL